MSSGEPITLRSYRRVFRVDWRIHRIDRWTLPVPGGLPVRAVGYFVAVEALVLILGHLPGLAGIVGLAPAPLRYLLLPLAIAVIGVQYAPDGRPLHRVAADLVGYRLRARRRAGGRALAREGSAIAWARPVMARSDERRPALGRGRVLGPATVHFAEPLALAPGRGGRRLARPLGHADRRARQGLVVDRVALAPGEILEVRP